METVLSQFTLKKDLALNKIQLLTNEEQQLIKDFNPKTFDFPSEVNLVSLFQQQAELKSDAIALVFEEIRLTFQELNAWSNRIAPGGPACTRSEGRKQSAHFAEPWGGYDCFNFRDIKSRSCICSYRF